MTAAARSDSKRWQHSIDDACMYGNGGLRNLDSLLRMMGRNVSEGGGSISEATEDDRRCRSATEDDGSGGSFWKMMEDGSSTYYHRVFGGRAEVMCIIGVVFLVFG